VPPTSADITRRANSNLAFALHILPKQRREDMRVFYAFCRTVDDLADDDEIPLEQRRAALQQWHDGINHRFERPDPLQQELISLRDRHEIPNALMLGIIEGCQMDLNIQRFECWDDLEDYIWKVSCTVGLVSIRLFGCETPESESYAISLAKALQLTNILRDVGEDMRDRQRIYLPMQDLHQFGYSTDELTRGVRNERFLEMMDFQAVRAQNFYEEAELNLTSHDRAALRPARIMSDTYHNLLQQMRKDQFQVFTKRYHISKQLKLMILIKHLLT